MENRIITQLAVVHEQTAEEFQRKFNSTMAALAGNNPKHQFRPEMGFCAYITYEDVECIAETVSDEYHAEGIRFDCKNCPLHEEVTDKRVKRVKCKYADLGFTHLDHEACEVFYRRLNLAELKPIGEPKEYGVKKHGSYEDKVAAFLAERR